MREKLLNVPFLTLLVLTVVLSVGLTLESVQVSFGNEVVELYAGTANPGLVYKYIGEDNWELISTEEELGHAYAVLSLVEYKSQSYAGTMSTSDPESGVGRVYSYDGNSWTLVGDNMDNQVSSLTVYQGDLYAGTAWGAMNLYKYTPGTTNCNIPNWTRVVNCTDWSGTRTLYVSHGYLLMGDILWDYIGRWDGSTFYMDQTTMTGSCIYDFEDYGDYVYAAAYYGRMWRSPDGFNWGRILGYYDAHMWELETFQNLLYMAYDNGELRASNGSDRGTLVFQASDGIISMETDGDYLYFGTGGEAGYCGETTGSGEVYRYDGTNDPESISGPTIMGIGVQCLYHIPLLEKYAPILYLHPEEEFYPWGIYSMLDYSNLKNAKEIYNPRPAQLKDHDTEEYYLDMRDAIPYWRVPDGQSWEGDPFQIYGRQIEESYEGEDYIVLQYWLFYPFNDFKNDHEGDWEMVQVNLKKTTQEPKPIKLCYSHHWGGNWYFWGDLDDPIEETHPKIFIAEGGHGNWLTEGDHPVFGGTDKTSANGIALYPGSVNPLSISGTRDEKPYTLIDISSSPSWTKWKGKWGQKYLGPPFYLIPFSQGPQSPANIRYPTDKVKRWEDPIGWCEKLARRGKPSYSQYGAHAYSHPPGHIFLHAYDEENNHVGLTVRETETGEIQEIEANIPGTYFYVPSSYTDDQKEWMWIYTSGNILFKIEGGSEGEFDFAFSRYLKEKDKEVTVTYQDVQFIEDTIATVDVSPENPEYIMEIDLDGDGIIDERQRPNTVEETSTQNPIIVYPNPCYLNKGQTITMIDLPPNPKVYIYTISGELVRTLDDASEISTGGGSTTAFWNCRNDAGEQVARGIYIYFVPKSTQKRTGKIAIIK